MKQLSIVPESNSRQAILLLFFALIMLLTRIVPVYSLVFTNWPGPDGNFVNFAADDAVYQMRLVHNAIQHFPHRIFFDPFTYFPHGSQIHFGPFFTLIIAFFALVAGLGHPSAHLVNIIGAYTPAVMGALCLLPMYFLTRKLFNSTTAIFAAFVLALLPGEFFQRSALGFTDNHVAEVLFSTTVCAYLIYFLDAIQNYSWQNQSWKNILSSKPLLFAYGAGIFFGAFLLTWVPALLFGAIFLAYFIVQLLINHFHNQDSRYLLYFAIPFYGIPILMLLPYAIVNPSFALMYYSITQPVILLLMLSSTIISFGLAKVLHNSKIQPIFLPLGLIILAILSAIATKYLVPSVYNNLMVGVNLLFNVSNDFRTIAELRPGILDMAGKFSIQPLWQNLFWSVRFAAIALLVLLYRIFKYRKPGEIFLAIWTLVMLAATCSELRFIYYLAINAAILSGYFAYLAFTFLLHFSPQRKLIVLLQQLIVGGFALFFAIVSAAPILAILLDKKVQSGPHITQEWYTTLMWMRAHTPDPQGNPIQSNFDYTSGLYPIPKANEHYIYPSSAYGVATWWDFGHQITYIAHRIPNANPFQEGVIEENHAGVAPFFTTTSEVEAVKNLDSTGARYIMINSEIATAFFSNVAIWANDEKGWSNYVKFKNIAPNLENKLFVIDSPKFISSMLSRLYYYDCYALSHFRLIYESNDKYGLFTRTVNIKAANPQPQQFTAVLTQDYAKALDLYQRAPKTYWLDKNKTILVYAARPPVKNIKLFEKVNGATITGKAPSGQIVTVKLLLKTQYGRIFAYMQSVTAANNQFQITVPYPTEPMQGDGYQYDITPLGKYSLTVGNKSLSVDVPEKAVMDGENIKI